MAAAGLALFSTLGVHSTYVSIVLPAELIVSLGMGMSFVAMSSTALIGVNPEDAGVASALVNSTQQTGGTMGAALINTIATTATVSYLATHGTSAAALEAGAIHGYTTAFTFSAIVLAVAAVAAFALIRRAKDREAPAEAAGRGAAGPGRGLKAAAPHSAAPTAAAPSDQRRCGLGVVPVGQQRAQRGEQDQRLVEHGVVARLGDLDHRGHPPELLVHEGPDLGRDQSVLRAQQRSRQSTWSGRARRGRARRRRTARRRGGRTSTASRHRPA